MMSSDKSVAGLSFSSGLIVIAGGLLAFFVPIVIIVIIDRFHPLIFLDDPNLAAMVLSVFSLWTMNLILRQCYGFSLVTIGLGSLSASRIFIGCLIGCATATVYAIPRALLWPDDVVPFWVDGVFNVSPFHGIQIVIFGVLAGPLYEEVFFRGVLYRTLRTKLSWVPSTLLCTAAFALMHKPPVQMTGALLLGLVTCYVIERRGSITECFAIHASYNFFVLAERIGYEYATTVAHT